LLYHSISNALNDVHEIAVGPSAFCEQMAYLRERCHPLALEELVTLVRQQRVPAGAVAVTFDDGYVDNHLVARPILDRFGIPATFFVTTDRIEEEREFWWDVLTRTMLGPSSVPSELPIDLPDGSQLLATATPTERLAAYWSIYHAIVGRPADVRDEVLEAVRRWSGAAEEEADRRGRMSGAMLRDLAASDRHAIGAHSVRHEMLPRQSLDTQRCEVLESRDTLEQLLGRKITAFAYPFGAYSAETIEAVRAASFELAVTCEETPLGPDCDPLRLPRLTVSHQRAAAFTSWIDAVLFPAVGTARRQV